MKDKERPPSKLDASLIHPSSLIPHPSPVAAILLAAGRSRRMGAFKPLLPFGAPKTVIETCINNLLAAQVEEVVVVLGHRAEEMRERLSHLPIRFALNREVESEMSASIARGVEALTSEAGIVLIALADQPAVPPQVIENVIAAYNRTGAPLIVPEWQGRGGHPVLIDLKFRASLLNLDPQRGLRGLCCTRYGFVGRLPRVA
jgi:molybdenum cofactor cytidylyltransferase